MTDETATKESSSEVETTSDSENALAPARAVGQHDPAVSNVATAQANHNREYDINRQLGEGTEGDDLDTHIETRNVEHDLYIVQDLDPRRQIPGSSDYFDHKERREAEVQRAAAEGREPDLENPPPYGGTVVQTGVAVEHSGLNVEFVEPIATVDVPTQVDTLQNPELGSKVD